MCVINLAGEYEDFLENLQLHNRMLAQEQRGKQEAKKGLAFENSFYESPRKGGKGEQWMRSGPNSQRKEPKGYETRQDRGEPYASKQGSSRKSPASNKYSPQLQNTFRKTSKWDEQPREVATKNWEAEDDEW